MTKQKIKIATAAALFLVSAIATVIVIDSTIRTKTTCMVACKQAK